MHGVTEIMAKAVPIAERYDVKMGVEVHAPYYFDHPWIMRHLETAERLGTKHYGLVPDMGIFTKRLPRVARGRMERSVGRRRSWTTSAKRTNRASCPSTSSSRPARWAETPWTSRGGAVPPFGLHESEAAHGVHAVHLPHPRKVLRDARRRHRVRHSVRQDHSRAQGRNYEGYPSSEYEGNRHIQDAFPVDSVEQVRRQHAMFRRLLAA